MPIEPGEALGAPLPSVPGSWEQEDVILYHLGIGAGTPPTDPNELEYTYEGKGSLKVLPSFCVNPVFPALAGVTSVPGLEFNPATLLHGEQDIVLHKTPPTSAKVSSEGKVAEIWDKGKGALVVLELDTSDDQGELLATNRFSLFLRGEGGFGGESGPKPGNLPPDRAPDAVVESPTLPQQALLYRLSGDKNPLHADPDFAKLGGFDQPILHGLCTYGVVCKAVVDELLDGDTSRVARYQARFSGSVFPGETIVTSLWREDDQVIVSARVQERDADVLTNAAVWVR